MKDCTKCKHALWMRAKSGKLHPSGDGRCQYPWKLPQLPAAMYWIGKSPTPCGGLINRHQYNMEHCAYWERVELSKETQR